MNPGVILYRNMIFNMKAAILVVITEASDMNTSTGYLAGAVIALLVLGYLLYSLIRPEKF